MISKMLFYLFQIVLFLSIFIGGAKILGVELRIFESKDCNFNCICEDFERGTNCEDCEHDFQNLSECEDAEVVKYVKENLCRWSACWVDCMTYSEEIRNAYVEEDSEKLNQFISLFNKYHCCLIVEPTIPDYECSGGSLKKVSG